MQIYNAEHSDRESLEAFYLRLTGQAALCGWTIDQEKEVVRDIFIAKMSYKDIQRELCIHPGATPRKRSTNGHRFAKATWEFVVDGQFLPVRCHLGSKLPDKTGTHLLCPG